MARRSSVRREQDSLGFIEVKSASPYGPETERALRNFDISGRKAPVPLTCAMIRIKRAAATANGRCGSLSKQVATCIRRACDELLDPEFINGPMWARVFPVDIFGAGAGTSLHMNVNEGVARRASRFGAAVDPHLHVNLHQSSNDVVPSAIRMATLELSIGLLRELAALEEAILKKADASRDLRKTARTHLRDALPITLGLELHAWAVSLGRCRSWIQSSMAELQVIPLGGGPVGTALGIPEAFAAHVRAELGLQGPADRVEAVQSQAVLCHSMSMIRILAIELGRITADLRLMSSGPKSGLSEVKLPPVQPGSSAMPGKFNPSVPEMVGQVCLSVLGQDLSAALAVGSGQLDLNVMTPLIALTMLDSTDMLTQAVRTLKERCIDGLEFNAEVLESHFQRNSAVLMALAPSLGFLETAELIRRADAQDKPVLEFIREQGIPEQVLKDFDQALNQSLSWPFGPPWETNRDWDAVDQASWESFPASDSPGW